MMRMHGFDVRRPDSGAGITGRSRVHGAEFSDDILLDTPGGALYISDTIWGPPAQG